MYRLNVIMKDYLDNQKQLIDTHRQYLELNRLYQRNMTEYLTTIINTNNHTNEIAADLVSNISNSLTRINQQSETVDNDDSDVLNTAVDEDEQPHTLNIATVDEDEQPETTITENDQPVNNINSNEINVPQTRTSLARRQLSETRRQIDETREQLNSSRQTLDELRETREARENRRRIRERSYRPPLRENRQVTNTNSIPNSISNSNTNRDYSPNRFRSTYILPGISNVNNDEDISNIPVPVAIIDQECEIIPYSSLDNSQDLCPIDRIPFEDDENVMRIRFCGHIFREENLRRNFRTRSTCPVCRHNIITTITHNESFRTREHGSDSSLNNFLPDLEWFVRY
jgi:hypothetical protein